MEEYRHVPSSLTKRISNAPTLLRRMFDSLYLSQKTYSLISLIHTQCLDLRVSQRLEADWWVTFDMRSVHPIGSCHGWLWRRRWWWRMDIDGYTECGPHRTRPQLTIPYCGVEAHPSRLVVFVDYQGVLVVVVDDLPGTVSVNMIVSR